MKTIDIDALNADLLDLPLLRHPASTLDELVNQYDSGIRSVIDKHAPLRSKRIVLRQPAPWLTEEIRAARCELRHAERTWKATRLTIHEQIFEYKMERRNYLLERAKASYLNTKVQKCGSDQRSLYKIVNSLSGKSLIKTIPKHSNPREFATDFAEFFAIRGWRMSPTPGWTSTRQRPRFRTSAHLTNGMNVSSPSTPRAIALAVLRLFQLKL
jgi:hypothetical protein